MRWAEVRDPDLVIDGAVARGAPQRGRGPTASQHVHPGRVARSPGVAPSATGSPSGRWHTTRSLAICTAGLHNRHGPAVGPAQTIAAMACRPSWTGVEWVSVHSLLSLTSPSTSARCKVDLVTGRLTLRGDLDHHLQPQLAACVTALTAARPRVWLVDLRDVAFCDVPSLRVFAALERAARRRSAALLLAGASPALRDLLGLVGLGSLLVDVPEPSEPATAGLPDAERVR